MAATLASVLVVLDLMLPLLDLKADAILRVSWTRSAAQHGCG
jgi:hypothetical protein